MSKSRLEAFSDAVLAILITIMVLELRAPHAPTWAALLPLVPTFTTYLLSFVFLAIYWNNHHHMLQAAESINGRILWANMHLLFWLSLVPFVTGWMGENDFASLPTAAYGVVLLLAGVAYLVLQRTLVTEHGAGSRLARALGRDWKGKLSAALYGVGIPLAFVVRWIALGIYFAVAIMWLIPDRRFESVLTD